MIVPWKQHIIFLRAGSGKKDNSMETNSQKKSINSFNTLRLRQNGCHFPDDIFKCIFLNENVWISIKISVKFVPMDPINNIPALV